ncbi:MAG: hypothetical protein KGN77_05680 [Xanthomonadaceae bacterium]|nr:hypothetical protein [Xanthomonadaceae bacterium]MDE1963419.1 hypothetical protein [Xanthomonadaceae bacterium]
MMRPIVLVACALGGACFSIGGAQASDASSGAHGVSRIKVERVHRAVDRDAAEVARLRRRVAEQEARSRQADQRLHEQDLALERLRRQLTAAGAAGEAIASGPQTGRVP